MAALNYGYSKVAYLMMMVESIRRHISRHVNIGHPATSVADETATVNVCCCCCPKTAPPKQIVVCLRQLQVFFPRYTPALPVFPIW